MGGNSKIVHKELPQDDPSRRRPDISFAEKMLGWKPQIEFDEGLERTINYFDNILEN